MQSHPDMDALHRNRGAQVLKELETLAAQRLADGTSKITAGAADEAPIREEQVGMFTIRQMPDDPLCLRVSIGESNDVAESGYLVFRGPADQIEPLLVRALSALRASHFPW